MRRDLRLAFRPGELAMLVVNPLLFLGGFDLLFGRVFAAEGVRYGQFLTPAIVSICGLFIGQDAGNRLAADRRSGLLARYGSMPIWMGCVLAARLTADAARVLCSVIVTVLIGSLMGFRLESGPSAVAFLGISVAFGVALVSLGASLGAASPRVHALQPIIFLPLLLLFQISTALVPAQDLTGWLRPVSSASPFSAVIDALRGLSGGGPAASSAWPAVIWCGVLILVFTALGGRALRRSR
jgi:ABC-2 type transport system permease protein